MDFFEVVKQRHSMRSFKATLVEQEELERILESANRAPSAGNLQGYEIYLVKKASDRSALARAAGGQGFVAEAPVSLVFLAHPMRSSPQYGARGASLYAVQDATIACTFAMLAATTLGLATVWVGAFDDNAVSRVIRAPAALRPVAILPIGYAAAQPEPTSRRTLQDLVHEV
jgi:nitroreductase